MATTLTSTGITFPDATTQTTAASDPTTATVLSATAGASVGVVGSYAFLGVVSTSTSYTPGQTAAGSGLDYISVNTTTLPGTSPAGTWRCMGYGYRNSGGETPQKYGTVWLRIS